MMHDAKLTQGAKPRIDLAPLYRRAIGFDRYEDMFAQAFASESGMNGYPPFNIEKTADDAYRISIAIAGFSQPEISAEVREGVLIVTARKEAEDSRSYLHRGIATRSFEKRFQLADHVHVTDAFCQDGLLHINLLREIPEALKPRKIAISPGKAIEAAPEGKKAKAA